MYTKTNSSILNKRLKKENHWSKE